MRRLTTFHWALLISVGTHAGLLAAGGRYAELHRLQQLEEELEAS